MRLYLVRHSETDWNKARRIQGQADIPLNAFGRHLAEETAKGLAPVSFAACYSSPLGRAVETAELILGGRGLPVITDGRLSEMSFGKWEGKCCKKDNWELPETFRKFFEDPEHYEGAPGGEDFYNVKKRVGEFLEWLCAKEEYAGENILAVSHGAAIAGILNTIKQAPLSEYWGGGVHKNCGVTEIEAADGAFCIVSENKVYYTGPAEGRA